jgi:hypothetical protein
MKIDRHFSSIVAKETCLPSPEYPKNTWIFSCSGTIFYEPVNRNLRQKNEEYAGDISTGDQVTSPGLKHFSDMV